MGKDAIITALEADQLKTDLPSFKIGDTIRVHTRIVEVVQADKKGAKETEKERIQVFMGTVIARKGSGLSETFSLHRVSYGEGMERVFLLHSPKIAKIELMKRGRVRRSKLYYLRGTSGKKAKVQEYLGVRAAKGSKKNSNPQAEAASAS